jgi:hypothetical protein
VASSANLCEMQNLGSYPRPMNGNLHCKLVTLLAETHQETKAMCTWYSLPLLWEARETLGVTG